MELRDEITYTFYGNVGVKANFTDSNGDVLYVGDIVRIEGTDNLSVVCGNRSNTDFNILGIWNIKDFCGGSNWRIYKEKSHKSMSKGSKIRSLKYVETSVREMTIGQIEEILGYPIKIIKEN